MSVRENQIHTLSPIFCKKSQFVFLFFSRFYFLYRKARISYLKGTGTLWVLIFTRSRRRYRDFRTIQIFWNYVSEKRKDLWILVDTRPQTEIFFFGKNIMRGASLNLNCYEAVVKVRCKKKIKLKSFKSELYQKSMNDILIRYNFAVGYFLKSNFFVKSISRKISWKWISRKSSFFSRSDFDNFWRLDLREQADIPAVSLSLELLTKNLLRERNI